MYISKTRCLKLLALIYIVDIAKEAVCVSYSDDVTIRNKRQTSGVCPPLPSTDTYDTVCYSTKGKVPCENSEEGTSARIVCRPYYVYRGIRSNIYCRNGTWDPYPAPCEPECGQQNANPIKTVINSTNSFPEAFPWVVSIYKISMRNTPACSGSIISRSYVVTIAHCLTDQDGNPYPDHDFTIAAGKRYSSFNNSESGVQIRKIKRKYIHEDYRGRLQKFRDDIALIEVEKFEITPQVQLICIDWSNSYEQQDFQDNNKGVAAGLGFTEDLKISQFLTKHHVSYWSTNLCKQKIDADFFEQYYFSDKICGGYDEGNSVCNLISGGGLYFKSQPATFYIRGIVGLAPHSLAGCSKYALYTKVSKYLSWVEGITRKRL